MAEIVAHRAIDGFPGYRVSSAGVVETCWKQLSPNVGGRCVGPRRGIGEVWRPLKVRLNRTGYHRAVLYAGLIRREEFVHLLVLEAFVGPRPEGLFGLHKDDDRSNNSLSNLYYGTSQQNWADRKRNGRYRPVYGDGAPRTKVSDAQVAEMRALRKDGWTLKQLAAKYEVTISNVSAICVGRSRVVTGQNRRSEAS